MRPSSTRSPSSPRASAASSRRSTPCLASRSPRPSSSRVPGGPIYDRGVDGSECHWARVLAFEPPDRVVFSWDISPQWQIETNLARTSVVEVRFISEAPERTRVELEHRNLDRHGEGWEASPRGGRRRPGLAALPAEVRRRSGRVGGPISRCRRRPAMGLLRHPKSLQRSSGC